jgi:3-hydroxybutyryl-CoA dehydratase
VQEYTLQTLSVGTSHSFEVTITDDMMRSFELMTGDDNPLHVDVSFAAARGHRERVVYGMLVASFYSTLVGVYLPGRDALLQEVEVSFRKPVYPGDRLTVRGEVVGVSEAVRQVEIRAEVINQDGITVSKARVKAGIQSGPVGRPS